VRTAGSVLSTSSSAAFAPHPSASNCLPYARSGRRAISVRVMATAGSGKRVVLWFRNDLRLHDNYVVHDAAQRVKRGEASEVGARVVQLYVMQLGGCQRVSAHDCGL
jgi:hypothetical protein